MQLVEGMKAQRMSVQVICLDIVPGGAEDPQQQQANRKASLAVLSEISAEAGGREIRWVLPGGGSLPPYSA